MGRLDAVHPPRGLDPVPTFDAHRSRLAWNQPGQGGSPAVPSEAPRSQSVAAPKRRPSRCPQFGHLGLRVNRWKRPRPSVRADPRSDVATPSFLNSSEFPYRRGLDGFEGVMHPSPATGCHPGGTMAASVRLVAAAVLLAVSLTAAAGARAMPAPPLSDPFVMTATSFTSGYSPSYIGNGYVGTRIPAQGMGYVAGATVPTTTIVAGVWQQTASQDVGSGPSRRPSGSTISITTCPAPTRTGRR
jgi:hypothetical protein